MKPYDLQYYLGNGLSVVSKWCDGSVDREKIAPRQTCRLLPRCCTGLLTAFTVVTSLALMPGYAAAEATVVESVRSDNRDLHLVVKPGETLSAILLRELETVEDLSLIHI